MMKSFELSFILCHLSLRNDKWKMENVTPKGVTL